MRAYVAQRGKEEDSKGSQKLSEKSNWVAFQKILNRETYCPKL
jgi:hypothetical protein